MRADFFRRQFSSQLSNQCCGLLRSQFKVSGPAKKLLPEDSIRVRRGGKGGIALEFRKKVWGFSLEIMDERFKSALIQ